MQVIDTRGLSCPQPVLMVKKTVDSKLKEIVEVLREFKAEFENIHTLENRKKGFLRKLLEM